MWCTGWSEKSYSKDMLLLAVGVFRSVFVLPSSTTNTSQIVNKYYQCETHYPQIPITFLWRIREKENLTFYTRTRLVDKSRQISFPWNYLLKKYVVLLIVIAHERSGSRCVGVLTPLQCTLLTEKLYVFAYVNLADTLKREN